MRTCTDTTLSCHSQGVRSLPRQRAGFKTARNAEFTVQVPATGPGGSETVFDLLYDEYLPFRLYADFMLGSSTAALASQFALSEDWVIERIKAMRWCLEKQVRLNLLQPQSPSPLPRFHAAGPAA